MIATHGFSRGANRGLPGTRAARGVLLQTALMTLLLSVALCGQAEAAGVAAGNNHTCMLTRDGHW